MFIDLKQNKPVNYLIGTRHLEVSWQGREEPPGTKRTENYKIFPEKMNMQIDRDLESKRQREKREQTLIFCESVNNIVNRSIPKPQPAVGGKPYSKAVQNVSSKAIASSSPDCRS